MIYQLATGHETLQNKNVWHTILVEMGSTQAWYEPDKTYAQANALAQQRHARIIDLVPNDTLHSGDSGYAVTMLKCG